MSRNELIDYIDVHIVETGRKLLTSTVEVYGYPSNAKRSPVRGHGIHIGDGKVVTTHHFFDVLNSNKLTVNGIFPFQDNITYGSSAMKASVFEGYDFSLLEFDDIEFPAAHQKLLKKPNLKKRDLVICPSHRPQQTIVGSIVDWEEFFRYIPKRETPFFDRPYDKTSTKDLYPVHLHKPDSSFPGMSGCPVANISGELVGMLIGGISKPQSSIAFMFFLSSALIQRTLISHNLI